MRDAFERRDQYALKITPIQGIGTSLVQSNNGTGINARGRRGSGSSTLTPWKISVTKTGGQYLARVRPGSVNSLVPSNIFDTFNITNGTWFMKIKCDTDGKSVNAVTLQCDGNAPAGLLAEENITPSTFYDSIGLITATPGTNGNLTIQIFQVRTTNLTATPVIDFLVSRVAPSPLDEPFVRWYKWSIAA